MARPAQHVLGQAFLDHAAVLHHHHAVGDLGHDAEVMGDEQHAGVAPLAQLLDQFQDLRLRGDVERRGRLVRDEQHGIQHERRRDHDPLALAAGELMRIDVDQAVRLGQAHGLHHLEHALAPRSVVLIGVDGEHLGDLVADTHHRIERRHRLLEDHRHAVAAHPPQLARRLRQEIVALEQDTAGHGRELARQQAHDGVRGDRLARSGLADDADDLAGLNRERDLLDRILAVRALRQLHRQAVDFEHGSCCGHG